MPEMTSEERAYLEQRREELKQELADFAAGKRRPLYVDPAERLQQLRDELDNVEFELQQDEGTPQRNEDERTDPGKANP